MIVVREIRRVRHVRQWPKVLGKVSESRVTVDTDSDGTTYGAEVEYLYDVGGTPYTGLESMITIQTAARRRAEKICATYHAGRQVQIAYNPAHRDQSEIAEETEGRVRIYTVVFGLGVIGCSIVWLILLISGK